jgi:predicted nucleic acid-binding protein
MTWVLDASVAVIWFVEEARSMIVRTVLASGKPIIAPDLIVPEVCNTAWKKARRGEISWAQAEALVQALTLSFEKLVETVPLASRVLALARQFDHPTHDCFYLALADPASATLVTDDARLVALARAARRGKLIKTLAAPINPR